MRYFLRYFFSSFILCLISCSSQSQSFDGPPQSPLPVIGRYVELYGALSSPYVDEYFQQKVSLLASFIPETRLHFEVTLLNTSQAMAFTPGGGYIIISKGLITHLRQESELMFLLAHEMGHEALGHTKSENLFGTDPHAREALELQADQFATMLLARAGFDPSCGLHALDDAHEGFLEEQYSSVYPTLEKRRFALEKILSDLPFQVYSEEDDTGFKKIKRSL